MRGVVLQDLIVAIGGRPISLDRLDRPIHGVQFDSRQVQAGDVFFALPGDSHDGHDFIRDAHWRGAACCVVAKSSSRDLSIPCVEVDDVAAALRAFAAWRRHSCDAMVIGITGSNGKTTTRTMLHAVLSARFAGVQSPRNFNNHVGVPLSLLAIEPSHEFAVIEMGASHTGEIADLAELARPEAAVITTIAPAHLGDFGSLDNIVQAKGELVEAVPESGFVVLNGDDDRALSLRARAACRTITIGEHADNDVRAHSVNVENERILFQVDNSPFRVRAIGRHHLTAALACVAVGREVGLNDREIADGLLRFEAVGGRCRRHTIGEWTVIDDTYNANPASMQAACNILRDWQDINNRWLIIGDMLALGERSDEFHERLGAIAAASGLDGLAVVGDQADIVVAAAKKNGMDVGRLGTFRDHGALMQMLECWLEPGDLVLVKGSRGMRMERIVDGLRELAAASHRTEPLRQAA